MTCEYQSSIIFEACDARVQISAKSRLRKRSFFRLKLRSESEANLILTVFDRPDVKLYFLRIVENQIPLPG